MAEKLVTPTVQRLGRRVFIFTWSLNSTDSGAAVEVADFPDKTLHVFGSDFDSGTMTLKGSNDPRAAVDRAAGTLYTSKTADWQSLVDPQGNAIAKAAAAIEAVLEDPQYISPVMSGGGASTSKFITVVLLCRGGI